LKPIVGSTEKYDRFWSVGLAFNRPEDQQIYFVPFELSLANARDFAALRYDPLSILDSPSGDVGLLNSQASGRIRLYPHGVGVIRLKLTLTFESAINLQMVARFVRMVEDVYFLGPEDVPVRFGTVLLTTVDSILEVLFGDDGPTTADVCWQPPTTTFNITQSETGDEPQLLSKLAHLMSRAPGNSEAENVLQARLERIALTNDWANGGVLGAGGEGVSLSYVGHNANSVAKERANRFQSWMAEMFELIRVASYCQEAFEQEINDIARMRLLDATWLPGAQNGKFEMLGRLIEEMRQVKRAISLIPKHLRQHGPGVVMNCARMAWLQATTPNSSTVLAFQYIVGWLEENSSRLPPSASAAVINQIEDIKNIAPPFD
jgi:hypothetical protein